MAAAARGILEIALSRRLVIATAESCTGGMISAAITDIAGSSAVFDRGFVTYSDAAKVAMLGVSLQTLTQFGAVSEEVAREMALGALSRSTADIAVSTTGIAGPGAQGKKPEGRVCFAVAQRELPVFSETMDFGAIGRGKVRQASVDHALGLLRAAIERTA